MNSRFFKKFCLLWAVLLLPLSFLFSGCQEQRGESSKENLSTRLVESINKKDKNVIQRILHEELNADAEIEKLFLETGSAGIQNPILLYSDHPISSSRQILTVEGDVILNEKKTKFKKIFSLENIHNRWYLILGEKK